MLADDVARQLRLAGLPERADGGFAVQPDRELVYVTWSVPDELAEPAFAQLIGGNPGGLAVRRMGTVLHAMAGAMQQILSAAGFDARLSEDDMIPATVEVRPGS
jgi:hypothetical protein